MYKNEKWSQWHPANLDLDGNYHFKAIIDSDGFKLLISKLKQSEIVEINFKDSIWAYRNTSESFRQNLFMRLSQQYGDDFYIAWSFFKVENSAYLEWLSEQSETLTKHLKLQHFVIMTIDGVIDIVANYEPEIKIYL